MDAILCPQCGHDNPVEARVCEQCNVDLSPVKSIIDTANAHFNEALSLAHEGRLDEALGQLDAAIALSSQNPAYYNLRGTLFAQKGLFSEAIHAWEQCIELHPEMEKAFQNIDKARRMEETRAEEFEQRPQWITSTIALVVAGVFLITTLFLGIHSVIQSGQIKNLTNNYLAKEKEASSWKTQFESITAQFPQEGINGVLKKLTQSETLIADKDKRITELEQKSERASENFRDRMNEFRDNIKQLQQEKTDLEQRLKTIDNLQSVIVQNETQIDTLQEQVSTLKESLKSANERIETHKKNLLVAQENIRTLQAGRDSLVETTKKGTENEVMDLRNQNLELRDEIAKWERSSKDRAYADTLLVEALQHLDENEFALARQSIETALERSPDNPAATHLQAYIDKILDDPLEQEIRRMNKIEQDKRRVSIKSELIATNLQQAKSDYLAGNFDQAIDLAQRTLTLKPDNPKDQENLIGIINQSEERNREIVLQLLDARKKIEANSYKEASVILKQILQKAPAHEEAKALLERIPQ